MMLQLQTKTQTQTTILNSEFSQTYRISPWVFFPLYYLGKNLVLPHYFGKIALTGQENIPPQGPVIFAPTHRSRWDGIVIAIATYPILQCPLRFMVTESEMKGLQGLILKRVGCFPVEIEKPTLSSFRHSVDVLSNQEKLVIFPEGGIFQDTIVHPIKPGIARIALQAQTAQESDVTIIPVSLHYDNIQPKFGTNIYLDFGQAINVANYAQGSTKKNAQLLTADLETKLTNLYNFRINNLISQEN